MDFGSGISDRPGNDGPRTTINPQFPTNNGPRTTARVAGGQRTTDGVASFPSGRSGGLRSARPVLWMGAAACVLADVAVLVVCGWQVFVALTLIAGLSMGWLVWSELRTAWVMCADDRGGEAAEVRSEK